MQAEDKPPFTAVILTALKTETRAVRSFMRDTTPVTCPSAARTYVEGWFHQRGDGHGDAAPWRILLRETGRDQGGAGEGTRDAADDWQPDVIIFVGCAGGRPKKIRHFNVIVAQSVSYYEKAKIEAEGTKHHIETYALVARRFLDIARIVRDEEDASGRFTWINRVERISPLGNRLADLKVLADLDATIEPIASGEKVITDPDSPLWKQLENEVYRVAATETEAAGFAGARCEYRNGSPIPRLMVRGISDLLSDKNQTEEQARQADPKRPAYLSDLSDGEERQRIAATAAAAFVFEVLARYTQSTPARQTGNTAAPPPERGGVTLWLDVDTDDAAVKKAAQLIALVCQLGTQVDVKMGTVRPGGSRFIDLEGDDNARAVIAALSDAGLLPALTGVGTRVEAISSPDPVPTDPALRDLIRAIHLLGDEKQRQQGQDLLAALGRQNPSWQPVLIRMLTAAGVEPIDLRVEGQAELDRMVFPQGEPIRLVCRGDVHNLTALAGLSALTSLTLGYTQVSDLTPLAGLTALISLDLANTQVSDLTPIASLSGLTRLNLMGTQVSDLTALVGLCALTSLDLWSTNVSDLAPLIELKELKHIHTPDGEVLTSRQEISAYVATVRPQT